MNSMGKQNISWGQRQTLSNSPDCSVSGGERSFSSTCCSVWGSANCLLSSTWKNGRRKQWRSQCKITQTQISWVWYKLLLNLRQWGFFYFSVLCEGFHLIVHSLTTCNKRKVIAPNTWILLNQFLSESLNKLTVICQSWSISGVLLEERCRVFLPPFII